MTYKEWKKRRLQRVPGRCGGNPVFVGSRIQPCDVHHISLYVMGFAAQAASFGVNKEDIVYAKRFCAEEPHWQMLRSGYDHVQGRELTEAEYDALSAKWKLKRPSKRRVRRA